MIAVYTGRMPAVTIASEVYLRNVPTYIKPMVRKVVSNHDDMVVYNPEIHRFENSGKYIYIVLPTHIDLFLASINFIQRCKEYYPLCRIKVRCDPAFKWLLPKGVLLEDLSVSNNSKDNYREYNLHLSKKQREDYSLQYPNFCWEQIFLLMTKLYNGVTDQQMTPSTLENSIEGKTAITIFGSGDNKCEKIDGLGEELNNSIPSAIYFDQMKYDGASIKSYIDAIKQSKYVVYCGDTDLSFLAPYYNVPCFVAIGTARVNKLRYLDKFKNITYYLINSGKYSIEELVSKISVLVGVDSKIESETISKKKKKKWKEPIIEEPIEEPTIDQIDEFFYDIETKEDYEHSQG